MHQMKRSHEIFGLKMTGKQACRQAIIISFLFEKGSHHGLPLCHKKSQSGGGVSPCMVRELERGIIRRLLRLTRSCV